MQIVIVAGVCMCEGCLQISIVTGEVNDILL